VRPSSPHGSSADPALFVNPLFFEVVEVAGTAPEVGQGRSLRTIAPNLSLSFRKASSNACFHDSAPTKSICRTLVHRILCTKHQAKRPIRCIIWVSSSDNGRAFLFSGADLSRSRSGITGSTGDALHAGNGQARPFRGSRALLLSAATCLRSRCQGRKITLTPKSAIMPVTRGSDLAEPAAGGGLSDRLSGCAVCQDSRCRSDTQQGDLYG